MANTPTPPASETGKQTDEPKAPVGKKIGLSIGKLKKGPKVKKEGVVIEELTLEEREKLPKTEVTQEQLMAKWIEFAKTKKANGEDSFYATLTLSEPNIDGNNINFGISNSVQEQDLTTQKQALLDFLRKELNNFSLDLVVQKNKSVTKKMLYSDEDRLKEMIKKNSNIEDLITRLGLDL